MTNNLEYYKVFYYVAKNKKISLAADKLFVSQPAITQTIQKLEEQLDIVKKKIERIQNNKYH